MKLRFIIIFSLLSSLLHAQALRDINFSYQYDPEQRVAFKMKPVNDGSGWKVLYHLNVGDTADLSNFEIQWQGRDALNTKDGNDLSGLIDDNVSRKTGTGLSGYIAFELQDAPKIVVAKIVNVPMKQAYLFYCALETEYPVNNFLLIDGVPVARPYVPTGATAVLANTQKPYVVSYYKHSFPPAAPAFSEGQAKVAKTLKPDSIFTTTDGSITFFDNGLYLFQDDTLSSRAFAVRAENDYPRYGKVQNLPPPMIYICTKQEYDKLEMAKGDKKTFDRTVLGITNDEDRARSLIKNYFRRVELANQYFTSYKEGWKTDRGMIYIVYGIPDKVYRFFDREVWEYKQGSFNATFNFAKSSSLFDPDNYVLIRDKKYQPVWYNVVDAWRNVRL
jgi:GWxTD domain-containing protein